MAISPYVQSHGLLDYWRQELSEDIFYFNQILGKGTPILPVPVYTQQSRDVIASALNEAFELMQVELMYAIKPVWREDLIPFQQGQPLERQRLQLSSGYIQALGQRTTSVIQADAPIVYSQTNPLLGVDDTATITVVTDVDISEIEIYYRASDGAPAAADELWQITGQSLIVRRVNATTITITGHRALFVSPNYILRPYESPNFNEPNAANTEVAGDFVTAVDVYRVYPDTTAAVQIISDAWYRCNGNECADNVRNGCARIVDAGGGLINIRGFDYCQCYGESPSYVRVFYKAGYPLDAYQRPDRQLTRAVIRLANTIMPMKSCVICDMTFDQWYQDREQETMGQLYTSNPLGTMKGQVAAYKTVLHRQRGQGMKLTR